MEILETPSRVLRRIRENEARNAELPSLPSISFEDDDASASASFHRPQNVLHPHAFSESEVTTEDEDGGPTPGPQPKRFSSPTQETPVPANRPTRRETPGSSGSRVRFSKAIMTRSFLAARSDQSGSVDASRVSFVDGEDVLDAGTSRSSRQTDPAEDQERSHSSSSGSRSSSSIKQLPGANFDDTRDHDYERSRSRELDPQVYSGEEEEHGGEGISMADLTDVVDASGVPGSDDASHTKSYVEYESVVKAASEPRSSPFDPSKWATNVTRRRPRPQPQISNPVDSPSEQETSVDTPDLGSRTPPLESIEVSRETTDVNQRTFEAQPTPLARQRQTPSVSFSTPSSLAGGRTPPSARQSPFALVLNQVEETPMPAKRSPSQPTDSSAVSANTSTRSVKPSPQVRATSASPVQAIPAPNYFYNTPAGRRAYQLIGSAAHSRFKTPTPYPLRRQRFSLPSEGSSIVNRLSAASPADPNASYVSTASSHDLTIHPRANTSFDIVATSQGRLDHKKLQQELNRVNHILTKENTVLSDQNTKLTSRTVSLEEENAQLIADKKALVDLVYALKHGVEIHETEIDDLIGDGVLREDDREAVYAELEAVQLEREREKAELTRQLQSLHAVLQDEKAAHTTSRTRLQSDLAQAQDEAAKIGGLRAKLQARDEELAEARLLAQTLEGKQRLLVERLDAKMESEELHRANERNEDLLRAKADAEARAVALESDLQKLKLRTDDLQRTVSRFQEEKQRVEFDLDAERKKAARTQQELLDLDEAVEKHAQELATKHESLEDAMQRIRMLEEQRHNTSLQMENQLHELEGELEQMRAEKDSLAKAVRRLEAALDDAEKRATDFEGEKASFAVKVAVLEREKNDLSMRLTQVRLTDKDQTQPSTEADVISFVQHENLVTRLESELEDAHREIGRLRFKLQDSPGRKAIQSARDEKIRLLEQQKQELTEQLQALKKILGEHVSLWEEHVTEVLNMTGRSFTGRGARRVSDPIGIHKSILSLRGVTPRAPRHSNRDLSWASKSGVVSPSPDPVHAQLQSVQHDTSHLAHELQAAHDRLDAKFEELGKASSENVTLKNELTRAGQRIDALNLEVARLNRREERISTRLQRCKCLKCGKRFDASSIVRWAHEDHSSSSLLSEATPTKNKGDLSDVKRSLEERNVELADMKAQLRQLEGEKAQLQETAKKLNLNVEQANTRAQKAVERERKNADALKNVKDEGERQKLILQQERDAAREAVKELERELAEDRARLKDLETQQARQNKELASISSKLKLKETDMARVQSQLTAAKERSQKLGHELQVNADAVHKAQQLEQKLQDNQGVIEKLRQQRDSLAGDYKQLQTKLAQTTKDANATQKRLSKARAIHEIRASQIDIQRSVEQDLSADEHEAQCASEIDRIKKQANDKIAHLQQQLRQALKEMEVVAQELRDLRAERDQQGDLEAKVEDVRELEDRLGRMEQRALTAEEQFAEHKCSSGDLNIEALKAQHNKECKGLMIHMRYLKQCIRREMTMRGDLAYQKKYLLEIIGIMEKSEQAILATVARLGFPRPEPPRKASPLRRAFAVVLFTVRVQRAAKVWREQTASKQSVAEALEDVRRRRIVSG